MNTTIVFKFDPEQNLRPSDIYLSNIDGFNEDLVRENFMKGAESFKDDAYHIHETDYTFRDTFKFCKPGQDPMKRDSHNFGRMSELLEE